jgi:hypothetical protein
MAQDLLRLQVEGSRKRFPASESGKNGVEHAARGCGLGPSDQRKRPRHREVVSYGKTRRLIEITQIFVGQADRFAE